MIERDKFLENLGLTHRVSREGEAMIERDEFLTEAMGECWHEKIVSMAGYILPDGLCQKCKLKVNDERYFPLNNDFSTWAGFGRLWRWAQGKEWWEEFVRPYMIGSPFGCYDKVFDLINPDHFADAVYEYLKDRS